MHENDELSYFPSSLIANNLFGLRFDSNLHTKFLNMEKTKNAILQIKRSISMSLTLFQIQQVDLNRKIDSLQEKMQIYQNNIDNNITWFYAAVAIVTTVLAVSLYFLVTEFIKKGIQKGISDVEGTVKKEIELFKSENDRFKSQIDVRILKLIGENYPIRWAKGTVFGQFLEQGKYLKITGLSGPINWDYPTTKISINAKNGIEPISFIIVEKDQHSFTVELINYNFTMHGNIIEWTVIWQKIIESE